MSSTGRSVEEIDIAAVILTLDGAQVILLVAGDVLSFERSQPFHPGAARRGLVSDGARVNIAQVFRDRAQALDLQEVMDEYDVALPDSGIAAQDLPTAEQLDFQPFALGATFQEPVDERFHGMSAITRGQSQRAVGRRSGARLDRKQKMIHATNARLGIADAR